MKKILFLCFAWALIGSLSAWALPATYNFTCISGNSAANCTASVGSQFSVLVEEKLPDQVRFTVRNQIGVASSITQIYFDLGNFNPAILTDLDIEDQSAGVSFKLNANPKNLPSGNTISFQSDESAEPTSQGGVKPNGIDSSVEWLKLVMTLGTGYDYDSVESALNSGAIRIGMHIQGFANGGSESYVHNVVPEPGFYGALALGLSGLYLAVRRKRA